MTARKKEPLRLANGPTPKIVPQTDELPHVYLSHTVVHDKKLEQELLRCSGMRYRCFSFVYVWPGALYYAPRAVEAYAENLRVGNHIMMDSSAFSFHVFVMKHKDPSKVEKFKDQTLKQYIEFCKRDRKKWDWYATFDYKQDQPLIWEVTKELESHGLKPAPVYHGDSSLDWLKKWMDDGYLRIGISTLPWRKKDYRKQRLYYDQVFRVCEPYKVKLHGFAVTSLSLAMAYPWHSVDSSSWSRTASYGSIYCLDPDRGSLASVHVSMTGGLKSDTKTATQLSGQALKSVRDQVEEEGWDFDLLRRSLAYRFIYNGHLFSHFEKFKKSTEDSFVKWRRLI